MAASTAPNIDVSLLRSAASDILGAQGNVAADTAAATGQGFAAQGAAVEVGGYQNAAQIAQQNAALEGVSGQITEAQTAREVAATEGAQSAGFASAGFGKGGTALAALTASTRQGQLARQMIQTQTGINQGASLEQAVAANMEATAAGVQGQASTALQSAYTNAANSASKQAQDEMAALTGYLASVGAVGGTPGSPNLSSLSVSPEAGVALSTLSAAGVPGAAQLGTPSWQQGPDGQWVYGTGTGALGTGGGAPAFGATSIGGVSGNYSRTGGNYVPGTISIPGGLPTNNRRLFGAGL